MVDGRRARSGRFRGLLRGLRWTWSPTTVVDYQWHVRGIARPDGESTLRVRSESARGRVQAGGVRGRHRRCDLRARSVRRVVRRRACVGGARARRGARGRPRDRVPPDARHVRDGCDGAHDPRRRAGARHDRECLHVGLAASAARTHLDRSPREARGDAARGNALRRQRPRGHADGTLRSLRGEGRRRSAGRSRRV